MEDPIAGEKQAWDEYNELCRLVKNDIRSFLRKGQILKSLRDTERFKKLGDGGYETFNSFLNDPVLKISRGYAFQQIQAFDFYIGELHMPVEEVESIASIKLMIQAMNFINVKNLSNEQAIEVIEKAKVLSYSDFFAEVAPEEQKVIEGEVQPQQPAIAPTVEQRNEQDEYLRPSVKRCDMCDKHQIEYYDDQICNCSGKPHVINKSREADEPYQHEAVPVIEEGDQSGQQ